MTTQEYVAYENLLDGLLVDAPTRTLYWRNAEFHASIQTMARIIPAIVSALSEDARKQEILVSKAKDTYLNRTGSLKNAG